MLYNNFQAKVTIQQDKVLKMVFWYFTFGAHLMYKASNIYQHCMRLLLARKCDEDFCLVPDWLSRLVACYSQRCHLKSILAILNFQGLFLNTLRWFWTGVMYGILLQSYLLSFSKKSFSFRRRDSHDIYYLIVLDFSSCMRSRHPKTSCSFRAFTERNIEESNRIFIRGRLELVKEEW